MKIQCAITRSCAALLLAVGAASAFAQSPVAPPRTGTPPVAVPSAGDAPSELQSPAVVLSAVQLDDLLGPIALYPDPLVAQILPATTYPTDIVLAARLVAKGATTQELDGQPWDPSVRALAYYPSILKMLDERLAWTQSIGAAFLQQPDDVMDSVQRLRARARALGHLVDTPQQKVIVEEAEAQTTVVRIVPATTQVVYVPTYDPEIVYVRPCTTTWIGSPWVSFSAGFAIGAWLNMDCDWYGRRCYYPSGWSWRTCSAWSWYSYPRYHSYWRGPSWCGPSVYVGWNSWGHRHHYGYHGHRYAGGYHGTRHYDRHDHRTSDMSPRGWSRPSLGPSRGSGQGRTDDRTWARDVSRPSLHEGSRHVSSNSDMYKRTAGANVQRIEGGRNGPQARSADMVRRDLSSRSFTPPSKLDRNAVPGAGSRSDALRRDTRANGRTSGARPDVRTSTPASPNNRATTSPGGLRRSDTSLRAIPGNRSTGLRVPADMPRVRTTTPSRGGNPQVTTPRSTGRQGLSPRPSSGSSPRATAPSSGSRPSAQRPSSSPSRSSAPGPSRGSAPGHRRSK